MGSFTEGTGAAAARFQARLNTRIQRLKAIGAKTSRRDQLLALILVPFVFILAMTTAGVVKDVITGFVPNTGSLAPVLFLAGMVLFIAALFTTFIWVKTGGFGIFAD